jgi:hypothetical protein
MTDRIAYIDSRGNPQCVSCKSLADVPSEFNCVLNVLCTDLELALDCLRTFGGIPLPVAKAILRNMEPAHAAIDMAVHGRRFERERNPLRQVFDGGA